MELIDAISRRQSVRRFTPQAVPDTVITQLLEAAVLAPSAHGRQPWRFVVIAPGAGRHTLVAAMDAEWSVQLAADGTTVEQIDARRAASATRIIDAPALIMPCLDTTLLDVYPDAARQQAEYTMAVQSIGCAIQNILLRAVDLGYDAGWMCAPVFCGATVQRACALPDTIVPQALIPIGVMAAPPKRRPKRSGADLRIDR